MLEQLLSEPYPSRPRSARGWRPVVDVLEKDGNLVLRAEVPGIEQRDIDVKLEGNVLTLKGKRTLSDEEHQHYRRIESFLGPFSRSFTLPESVDRDQIRADYRNGILTITIAKKPEAKARPIPVDGN